MKAFWLSVGVGLAACGDVQSADPTSGALRDTIDDVTGRPVSGGGARVTAAPGTLDLAFGASGLAKVRFGADDDGRFVAMDVIDGKIVATGAGTGGLGEISMATIRLDPDGAIDPTWNGGSLVRTRFGHSSTGDDAEAMAVAHQRDGRSVIMGFNHDAGSTSPCPCTEDIAVARFSLAGGSGGDEFGTGGLATIDLGGSEDVRAGLVYPNDTLIVAGAQDGQFMVARLTSSGALDPTFAAPRGFDRVVHGVASEANAIALDNQGRLVVAGTLTTGGDTDLNVIRYRSDGTHDTAFGSVGEVIVAGAASERSVALRAFGRKLVLASSAVDAGVSSLRVRRFLADGTPDSSFGTMGIAEVVGAAPRDMVVLTDGRIVLLTEDSQLVRLTRSGALDRKFGPDGTGKVTVVFGEFGVPGGLQVYSDDQLLVSGGDAGGSPGPGTFGVVARYWM